MWPETGPRRDFVELLDTIRRANGMKPLRDIARAMRYGSTSQPRDMGWRLLLHKARLAPAVDRESTTERLLSAADDPVDEPVTDTANLLLRLYIPAERLYAAEAHHLLSLFREWLITVRGRHIRQSGYQTASGEVYEFFSEDSTEPADLRAELGQFSDFLTMSICGTSANGGCSPIRHSLEEELLDSAAELPAGADRQIIALVERGPVVVPAALGAVAC